MAKRKPKQAQIPETISPKIRKVHDAAVVYARVRDERMELQSSEADAKKNLKTVMHAAVDAGDLEFDPDGNAVYIHGDVTATLTREEKEDVKVKLAGGGEEED